MGRSQKPHKTKMIELNTENCLNNNVWDNVRTDLYYIVENNVWKNARDKVWDIVWNKVFHNVRENVQSNVWRDLNNHTKLK